MGTGIVVCGLNGAGKSTLGRALARRLKARYIDDEDLYFPKTDSDYPYASPRARDEAERLLLQEIQTHENFVFAAVKGGYGEAVRSFFRYAVWMEVPKDIRMGRVRDRSFEKFGSRMLPGGDLYQAEKRFFDFAASREEHEVEAWVRTLSCPVLRVDGTMPAEENAERIILHMRRQSPLGVEKGEFLW